MRMADPGIDDIMMEEMLCEDYSPKHSCISLPGDRQRRLEPHLMSEGNGAPPTGVVVSQRCLDVDTDFDDT